ncbi:MAG TPA: outer membrane lipoprotein-sorting protein, partial [Chthoniobacteraceae bacterium]|nr:outer membrane lipoprotein-sorting protein [Chthoniobacteraceae bacterium]
SSYIRLRLEVKQPGAAANVLQIQIKGRNTKAATELVYQVLWPKERKGEAVLLRKTAGRAASGSHFVPPDKLRAVEMSEPLFGSDLSYEDLVENFFAWPHQAIVGNEVVDRVSCEILESKPGGQHSSYASVRTWVDARRLVPMRIEKYLASGQLARRIETTNVAADDLRRPIPANLAVRGSRKDSVTELDGSRIRHDVTFADREFTAEGLKELTPPHSAAQ